MATINFLTTFSLDTTPKQFTFEDTSNYLGQDAYITGCFQIVAPSGAVIYNNTDFSQGGCDIWYSNSEFNQHLINLPIGTNGLPEIGVYTITYTAKDSDLSQTYTHVNTYTYAYVRPTIAIEQTVDCVSPLFTSTDATNYTSNLVVPTVLTRTHTLSYPNGSAGQGSPTVSSGAVITRGAAQFFQGVQTTQISTYLFYTFADGLIVSDTVSGTQNITVDCVNICNLRCCLNTLEARLEHEKCTNYTLYLQTKATFDLVMALVGLVQLNINCGNGANVNNMLNFIKELTNCTDSCNECGTDPNAPIIGVGTILNNVEVISGGVPIEVTSVVAGNLTTYSVKLSDTFVNSVNIAISDLAALTIVVAGLYNTEVVHGKGGGAISDSGIVAGTKTFTVDFPTTTDVHQFTKNFRTFGDGDTLTITDAESSAIFGTTPKEDLNIKVGAYVGGEWINFLNETGVTLEIVAGDILIHCDFAPVEPAIPVKVCLSGLSTLLTTSHYDYENEISAAVIKTDAQLTSEYSRVTAAPTTELSVQCFKAITGKHLVIKNDAVNAIYVYPYTGESFDNNSVNAPLTLGAADGTETVFNGTLHLFCFQTGKWTPLFSFMVP